MTTVFDFLTVAFFLMMAIGFFMLTERDGRTLLRLLFSGIAFAVANQIGNAGWQLLASILIAAGISNAVLVIKAAYTAPRDSS